MSTAGTFTLVDGLTLPEEQRALLRPGEPVRDFAGRTHFLPRFFYEVASWEQAKTTRLTVHFSMAELLVVDCREHAGLLNTFPHYVPCAVVILARYLQELRQRVEAPVFVACNGGYRSPSHQLSAPLGPHSWAAAANIYRVGDALLDDEKTIEKYARIAASIGPEVYTKPFGHGEDESDDHLHLDIGNVSCVPRACGEAR